jgi:hypothetical protein
MAWKTLFFNDVEELAWTFHHFQTPKWNKHLTKVSTAENTTKTLNLVTYYRIFTQQQFCSPADNTQHFYLLNYSLKGNYGYNPLFWMQPT